MAERPDATVASKSINNKVVSESEEDNEDQVPDWLLAKQGITLLLNNNVKAAEELFLKYPDSLPIYAAYSFATFMEALMTFEDDKVNFSIAVLKEVEKKCAHVNSGWFKNMKTKMFGHDRPEHSSLAFNLEVQVIMADSQVCLAILTFLQQDITGFLKGGWVLRKAWKYYQSAFNEIRAIYQELIGDLQLPALACQSFGTVDGRSSSESNDEEGGPPTPPPSINGYCQKNKPKIPYSQSAILTTNRTHPTPKNSIDTDTNTDCSSGTSSPNSMKNNCSRSSFSNNTNNTSPSSSSNCAHQITKSISVNSALSKHASSNQTGYDFWGSRMSPFTSSLSLAYFTSTFHIFSSKDKLKQADVDTETIERLMKAVSFGYGLFQLGISLLPPSLLRLTNFFGFSGNRTNGIACLMYARQGVDMRAPLATLSLLWYHTIVRPFYGIDGTNVTGGADAATALLKESEEEYGESAVFLFFKGRSFRLYSNIPEALKYFQMCTDVAAQREMKLLALHEVGWCNLIQLDYCNAESNFAYLKAYSKWSKTFYCYLSGICSGACESPAYETNLKEVGVTMNNIHKVNQLDEFLLRRAKYCHQKNDAQMANVDPVFWRLLVYEMLYLWNALTSCNNSNIESIRDECRNVPSDNKSYEPMLGLSKLILANCYCILKDYDLGIQSFRECLELRKNLPPNADDAHISAFCQYELAELLTKRPETKEEGKVLLQRMNQYRDYDFEQRLNVRVHTLLKQL